MKLHNKKTLTKIKTQKGWTVQEFADKIGVPLRTLENWLSGRTKPNVMLDAVLQRVLEGKP